MWSETLFSYFGRQRGKPLSKLKTRTECLNILSNPVRESLAENSVTQHPFSPNTLLLVCPVEFLAEDLVLLLLTFRISMCSPTVGRNPRIASDRIDAFYLRHVWPLNGSDKSHTRAKVWRRMSSINEN